MKYLKLVSQAMLTRQRAYADTTSVQINYVTSTISEEKTNIPGHFV